MSAYLEQGVLSGLGCVPGDERHEALAPRHRSATAAALSTVIVAGVLLTVPMHKQIVDLVQQRSEQIQQCEVWVRRGDTPGHDFKITGNFPFRDVRNATVVVDCLRIEQMKELIEVGAKVNAADKYNAMKAVKKRRKRQLIINQKKSIQEKNNTQ